MSNIHITAVFATNTAAHEARAGMIATGIDAGRILVLDRGHEDAGPPRPQNRLWAALRQFFVHDEDARHYAESIVRGNPLLVADVSDTERNAALDALRGFAPVSVTAQEEGTQRVGLAHADAAQTQAWISAYRDGVATANEGIVGGSVLAGDYGSVGAVHGAAANMDILRGKRASA
jgi:hypothetical protein